MFTKSLGVAAIVALAINAPTPLLAQAVYQESRVLMIDRADLLSAEGRAHINARIIRAARQVCEPSGRHTVQLMRGADACRATAIVDACRQLDRRVAAARNEVEIAVVAANTSSR